MKVDNLEDKKRLQNFRKALLELFNTHKLVITGGRVESTAHKAFNSRQETETALMSIDGLNGYYKDNA